MRFHFLAAVVAVAAVASVGADEFDGAPEHYSNAAASQNAGSVNRGLGEGPHNLLFQVCTS